MHSNGYSSNPGNTYFSYLESIQCNEIVRQNDAKKLLWAFPQTLLSVRQEKLDFHLLYMRASCIASSLRVCLPKKDESRSERSANILSILVSASHTVQHGSRRQHGLPVGTDKNLPLVFYIGQLCLERIDCIVSISASQKSWPASAYLSILGWNIVDVGVLTVPCACSLHEPSEMPWWIILLEHVSMHADISKKHWYHDGRIYFLRESAAV